MDINEYIASGSVENYVLGTASEQERQEVECMSHIYPEIKSALTAYQLGIEHLALSQSSPPPLDLKQRVLAQIKGELQDGEKQTKLISIEKSRKQSSSTFYKLIAAASIVLLLGGGFYAYEINSDLNNAELEISNNDKAFGEMVLDYNELNQSKSVIVHELEDLTEQMDFIRDENTEKVTLKGTAGYSDNMATVFWNESFKKVMLDVQNMPSTTSEESYQLWVLVGGQPIDMGVFDHNSSVGSLGLLEMKSTEKADAFAITREPKGGSESPTLAQLHVLGTI